jgi:hypothetical protein
VLSLRAIHAEYLEAEPISAATVVCTDDGYRLLDKEFTFKLNSKRTFFQQSL